MEYSCSICGAKISADMLIYKDHLESHIVDVIKARHPDWAEAGGVCPKCLDYYRSELKGEAPSGAACAGRRRRIRTFFSTLVALFQRRRRKRG
ncbi:MAG: hypothetical protein Q8Q08_02345 [Candidatus Omnitrophota bacterium]|nr:hypothetical protein [Candidatus Omnitrophota bacterium]MDZ4242991.1 hypothetical protein [Candidatus Omnitrophota bacterium]